MTSTSMLPVHMHTWFMQTTVALLGSWLLAAASWIEAPMWPVPMTLQTFALLVIGAMAGARLAAAIVAAYLVQGALGLPVFAGGAAGAAHLFGVTGGYLFGFLLAATLLGWLADRGWKYSFLSLLAAMAITHALVFVTGVAQLSMFVGWRAAIDGGLYPFIAGAIAKVFGAALTVRAANALFRR